MINSIFLQPAAPRKHRSRMVVRVVHVNCHWLTRCNCILHLRLRLRHTHTHTIILGTFKLVLEFDETYPNKPPQVRFLSKMFHPNVYADGKLCLDILQNRWSPTYDVGAILTSIQVGRILRSVIVSGPRSHALNDVILFAVSNSTVMSTVSLSFTTRIPIGIEKATRLT